MGSVGSSYDLLPGWRKLPRALRSSLFLKGTWMLASHQSVFLDDNVIRNLILMVYASFSFLYVCISSYHLEHGEARRTFICASLLDYLCSLPTERQDWAPCSRQRVSYQGSSPKVA